MRVLQIFNRYLQYGGEEGSVYRIGDALQAIAEVEYFITSTKEFLEGTDIPKILKPLLVIHNPLIAARLKRYQNVGRFDTWQIHNVFPSMSPTVYQLAFEKNIPVIQYLHNYRMSCVNGYFLNHGQTCTACIHGNFIKAAATGCWQDSRFKSGWLGLALIRLRSIQAFSKISAWIALSNAQKALHIEMGVPESKISLIPHYYEPLSPVTPISKGKDVLFVGRLSKEKGVSMLLKAWKMVEARGARLLLAGDGPEREALEMQVITEKIQGVEFLGFVPKKEHAQLWEQAAFSVVPSIWQDPLPTVVFEAWDRGKAVVVSAVGGLNDTVDHKRDGLKVELGNVEKFAEGIQTLLDQPDRCAEFAKAGKQKLLNVFSQDQWLEKMQMLYKKIRETPR